MARILQITEETVQEAAQAIRSGNLVAFPTETVYGLGANALDSQAVERIFSAKGRPVANPLIVHIGLPEDLQMLAEESPCARPLIERFWPGPLTLVLKKKPVVPDLVTADGPTVAVRMPAHPAALALIRVAGVPIAAPSANRSEDISPTLASHVAEGLGGAVDIILDAGPTQVGLESTVIDLTVWPPRILRPGMVLPSQIEEALGVCVQIGGVAAQRAARSPGQMRRHYAPRTPLRIVASEALAHLTERPLGLLALGSENVPLGLETSHVIAMPAEPSAYAARLYEALHEMDQANLTLIVVEEVPNSEPWMAIRDRLTRASRT